MTVSSSTNRVNYNGDDSTTVFAYTFKVFDQSDLTVILRSSNGTETVQTITTNYTVSGVGDAGGGNVTMVTAPATGEQLTILREQPLTQGLDLVPNDPFPANSIEESLDKITFMVQKHEEELGRAIKASRTNTISGAEFTVSASDRANKVFAFDSSGDLAVTQELGTFRGDWAASTAYSVRDLVKDTSTNNIFIVNSAHTSSGSQPLTTNANSAKYDLIVDAASAATSATNAATSATTATTKATEAATSATNAATSASNAATSATNASTSETNAASSATSASTAQTAAETAKTAAETAKTAAETAKTAAQTAQTAAETAETNAETAESNASTSETNAATSATTATTQATAAATSATNAATSATTATTKASEASTSATNAATSETNAATSATAAAASQTAAAASAASAATAYDSFDDRYLGTKTANPTVDNDGNALVQGALYFNSTANEMRVYDGANWIAASSAGGVSMLEYLYIATASQTAFSGSDENSNSLSYTVDNLIVIVNGVVLEPSVDYTATDGLTVTLTDAASLNDEIHIIAFKSFTTADMVSATNGGTFAGNVTFTGTFTSQGIDDNATSTALTIGSNGHVGIGGNTNYLLDVRADGGGASESILLQNTGTDAGDSAILRIATNNASNGYIFFADPEDSNAGEIRYSHASNFMSFDTNGAERLRINSSGKLSINDTDAEAFLHINGSGDTGPGIYLENFGATEGDITFNAGEILQVGSWATSTDTFTELMTIHNNGKVNFAKAGTVEIGRNEAANTYESGERGVQIYAGASNDNLLLFARDTSDGSPCYRHIIGGTTKAEIEANGDFLSATNSYGATSDQTLKENIVASGSQWDDLKAVQVKKFSYIADAQDEANMIGVIAQDLEASGMNGLVSSMDRGDGTMVKSVKYSVLYMKAIKALQEAMNRIETLETEMTSVKARLDALETN